MINIIEIIGLLACITGGIAWTYFQVTQNTKNNKKKVDTKNLK